MARLERGVPLPVFQEAASRALDDSQLRRNLGKVTQTIRAKRVAAADELPDWDALREASRALKARVLRHLDTYLLEPEAVALRLSARIFACAKRCATLKPCPGSRSETGGGSGVSRAEVLTRIRAALDDVPEDEAPEGVAVARRYRVQGDLSDMERVALFEERIADYKVKVARVHDRDLPVQVAASCRARGVTRLVVPGGVPETWVPAGLERLREAVGTAELDSSDGVLTGCALAVAQTGTIALDGGPGQGRRALTLLPDFHLCVVYEDQIVDLVPEAFAKLGASVRAGRPVTLISGPSATSDIELNRVEGVHGPRTLEVLLVHART